MGNANTARTGPRFELQLGEEGYPELLAQIPEPPERLYGIGDPAVLVPGIAVIGAMDCIETNRKFSSSRQRFSSRCCVKNISLLLTGVALLFLIRDH